MPSPPAEDTAAASRPPATPAIGAQTTGTDRWKRSVNQVRICSSSPDRTPPPARPDLALDSPSSCPRLARTGCRPDDEPMSPTTGEPSGSTVPELLVALRRWQDAGGVWRVVDRRDGAVTVALCRCDGG